MTKFSPYRRLKYAAPLFLAFYLLMVWLKPALGVQKTEIYPFFNWRLFSHTPGWEARAIGLIVHRVHSEHIPGGRYVVPGGDIRDHKVLYATMQACGRRPAACDAEAEERLWPIVTARTSTTDVEFSLVKTRIDLREVQRDIKKLARGEVQRQDFYRLHTVVGRWKPCATPVPKPTPVPAWSSGNSVTFTAPSSDRTARESLTASFMNVPVEHNGRSVFLFRVAFSDDIANSYRTLRDEAFAVTNGTITDARRHDGRNDLWVISVRPDSHEAVTITLPGGRGCGTSGAVCTGGRDPAALVNSPSATVAARSSLELCAVSVQA